MNWSDYNSNGVKVKGRTIVKGNVYIIGTELASSQKCNYHPLFSSHLIPPTELNKQVPSSAVNIFAGTAPSMFTAENGLQWRPTNLVELDSLYATGNIASMAPTRTLTKDLTLENASSCDPDTRTPDYGTFDTSTTPGVIKNATDRSATLPK